MHKTANSNRLASQLLEALFSKYRKLADQTLEIYCKADENYNCSTVTINFKDQPTAISLQKVSSILATLCTDRFFEAKVTRLNEFWLEIEVKLIESQSEAA
jgi:uncharacterized Zn-finger protein